MNANHLKIYIIHNATFATIGAVKIPILNQKIQFNVISPDRGTGISEIIGKSFPTLLQINIVKNV